MFVNNNSAVKWVRVVTDDLPSYCAMPRCSFVIGYALMDTAVSARSSNKK